MIELISIKIKNFWFHFLFFNLCPFFVLENYGEEEAVQCSAATNGASLTERRKSECVSECVCKRVV